jgi:hypothetical protein
MLGQSEPKHADRKTVKLSRRNEYSMDFASERSHLQPEIIENFFSVCSEHGELQEWTTKPSSPGNRLNDLAPSGEVS